MTTEELALARRERSATFDRRITELFDAAVPQPTGLAVVAVGGYGRSELSPHSDLDVVLVHDPAADPAEVARVADALWYPLWDDHVALDHAVRSTDAMRESARADHRVSLGLLDARTVAGDAAMVLGLRSQVLADYRRDARVRVELVRADRDARIARSGALAHAAVPDLKSSAGGLRDAVILRALVATWLVDVPHAEVESLRTELLDVRDALHQVAGRRSDRLLPELVPEAARLLGMQPEELDLHTRSVGRRIAHLCDLTWRRLDDVLHPRASRRGPRGPLITPLARGVGRLGDEVVLTAAADPVADPEVALRAAAAAARAGLPLSSVSAARLGATLGALAEPWPPSARRALVDLLTAGPGLVDVWYELDLAGVVDHWLPEWSAIRLRGSTSPVHQYTIDRHSIETCVLAAARQRDVDRPDLLAVAALLHDIGKGVPGDHSRVGEPMAVAVLRRWGFSATDAAVVGRLVRWHLLLPTAATRRDIEDPATVANVAEIVADLDVLDLLATLTAADAAATSATAWSSWRRGLVEGLVAKTRAHLGGAPEPEPQEYGGWPADVPYPDTSTGVEHGLSLTAAPHHGGSLLTVVTRDAPGLMATVAGALAVAGLDLRSVRSESHGDAAVSMWEVTRPDVDPAPVRQRVRAALAGDLDLAARLERPAPAGDHPLVLLPRQSHSTATLLEVRAADRRGLIWLVCRTIADAGHSIRSAHVSTYGAEVRDAFYVVDGDGRELGAAAAERLRAAIADVLA